VDAKGLRFGALGLRPANVLGPYGLPSLRVWLLSAAAVSFTLGIIALPAGGEEPPRFFEYLYIESNSGDSSGGHAAICFANRCYHFQQDETQTIRLHEDDSREFEYRYRLLGNRTIHASRFEVSASMYDRLRSVFEARLRIQDRQYEVLESLVRDRQLIEHLLGQDDGGGIQLPGSAYFFADEKDDAQAGVADIERSAAIARLAARVRATYGDDFLERRLVGLRDDVAQLIPATDASTLPAPEVSKLPLVPAGFATRYRELVSGWLALEVLRAALPLRAGNVHAPQDEEFALAPDEIDVLRAYAAQLAEALVRLPASNRPDWGYPMLVGMARLIALEASIDSGHLVLLDDFSEDAPVVSPAIVSKHEETLAQIRDQRRADLLKARHQLFDAASPSEVQLSLLETTGNLFIDIQRALVWGSPMRVYTGQLVPMKGAVRQDWPVPQLSPAVLRRALAVARDRERTYRAALKELYPYDLFSHNCVTEIFRTMDAGIVPTEPGGLPDPAAVHAASDARPEGYVEWRTTLSFIPFLSARAIGTTYRVEETVERPSYRRLTLDYMYGHENVVRVDLRESNILTARSYERNPDDPIFLFFTDDVVLRRPLYGIANLAVGIGGTLAGLALWPIDGGATLRAGLEGALFSFPEIAFINIRKGSFAFAPRSWLSTPSRNYGDVCCEVPPPFEGGGQAEVSALRSQSPPCPHPSTSSG
jgi:hypothetical protein